ncbi:hypothetical protein H4S14_002105 [Agrobacterium vitis]|nr:hypothetical protein [Agrobacterium vitis]MBE1438358.1 hypothetical protein [Agrobacterium vitis]
MHSAAPLIETKERAATQYFAEVAAHQSVEHSMFQLKQGDTLTFYFNALKENRLKTACFPYHYASAEPSSAGSTGASKDAPMSRPEAPC